LWFRGDGSGKADGYAIKWEHYRLAGKAITESELQHEPLSTLSPSMKTIKEEVEAARHRIANVAGVPFDAVKITIDFTP